MKHTLRALIPWYILATVLVGILALTALFIASSSTPTGFVGVQITNVETLATGGFVIAANASASEGNINIILSKTENTDPANTSFGEANLLNYTIIINVTNGSAFNITLTDLYPTQVVYNSSQPVATGPLNNTFNIGNLSNGTSFRVNITVNLHGNLSNGTVINNTVNITYANASGSVFTLNVTENTTIINKTGVCPGTITSSLTLTSDLQAKPGEICIEIGSNHVTLDCAGRTLTGVNGTGFGVYMTTKSNVTVKNCTIRAFFQGIFAANTDQSNFTNNKIYNNTDYGINLNVSSNDNEISYNTIYDNHLGGIYVYFISNGNNISYNNITDNDLYGIHIYRSFFNTVSYNNISNNTGWGLFNWFFSDFTAIYNNYFEYHLRGIEILIGSDDGFIRNNTLRNHSIAINITTSSTGWDTYFNYIYNDTVTHANTDSLTNPFDNSEAIPKGNFWDDVPSLDIFDSDSDGFGDTGADYPYTPANGGFVTGLVQDDGPIIIPASPPPTPPPTPTSGGGGGGGGGGCSDECTLGTTACAGISTALTCVSDYDADPCTEYAPDPCAAGEECVAGACVLCESSWLCDEWGPCIGGIRERSCVDVNACAIPTDVPSTEEPCALLPIIELPSPIIPLTYGAMFAGTPVTCVHTTKSSGMRIGTQSATIDLDQAVPAGYLLAAEPFSITCNGDNLEMTLTVPESFTDLRVLRCTEDTCVDAKTTEVSSLAHICGSTTLGRETQKKVVSSKSVFSPEGIAAIASASKKLSPGNNVITSGQYAFATSATLDVKMSGLNFAIPEPANPSLSIVGTPMIIDISNASPGAIPASLTMPLIATPGIDTESIGVFALVRDTWKPLGGKPYPSTGVITADVADISQYLVAGRAIIATLGIECTACTDITFEQAYRYPGAKTAIVAVHGTFSDESTFKFLLADIEATHQPFDVWTFAYPSTKTLDEIATALADLLASRMENYDRIYLVGHSVGGLIVQQALWISYERQDKVVGKVRRAVLVASPTGGSPAIDALRNLFERLINQRTVAKAFNINANLVQSAITGREIPRVPGIDYQVIAGTRPYAFNLNVLQGTKNDGLITTDSAQKVGQDRINDACRDYYEINLTHTELLDNDVGVRVIERIITSDIGKSTPEQVLAGQNKYVTFTVTDCKPSDRYVVVGKPLREEKRYDPTGCACGNGWCGEGETELSCPADCATIFTLESFCIGNNLLLLLLIITIAIIALAFLIRHFLRKRAMSVRWLHIGVAASFVALIIIILLVSICNTYPWLMIFILIVLAAYHVIALLFEKKHQHAPPKTAPFEVPQQVPLPPHEHIEKPPHAPQLRAVTPNINRMIRRESVDTHDRIEQARADLAAINQQLNVLKLQLRKRRSKKR